MEKKKWKVTIEFYRTYEVSAENADEAADIAYEFFENAGPDDVFVEEDYGTEEPDDCDYEVGFDPYMGCFTDEC